MLPFHPTFRRLLRRYIPLLHEHDLDRHESLVALRYQLMQERDACGRNPDLDQQIQATSNEAAAIFNKLNQEFKAVQRLYAASRKLALSQGHYLQVPTSLPKLGKLILYNLAFRWQQFRTFFSTLGKRIEYLTQKQELLRWPTVAIVIALISISTVVLGDRYRAVQPPEIPVVEIVRPQGDSDLERLSIVARMRIATDLPVEVNFQTVRLQTEMKSDGEMLSGVLSSRVSIITKTPDSESKAGFTDCKSDAFVRITDAKVVAEDGQKVVEAYYMLTLPVAGETKFRVTPQSNSHSISTSRNVFTGTTKRVFETDFTITPVGFTVK